MNELLDSIKKTPIVSFFVRYWLIIVLLAIFASLIFSNTLFAVVGMLLYLPALSLGALATALLLRNVFNSDTTDKDADSGRFVEEWNALDGRTRVILTVLQTLVYFSICGLIAAALAAR